jgi:hypothetical protein
LIGVDGLRERVLAQPDLTGGGSTWRALDHGDLFERP